MPEADGLFGRGLRHRQRGGPNPLGRHRLDLLGNLAAHRVGFLRTDDVWSKYSTERFSSRSRMMHGHHAKHKMGTVVGLCNGPGKPEVAAAKRIPGGREPDLALTPSHPPEADRSREIHTEI